MLMTLTKANVSPSSRRAITVAAGVAIALLYTTQSGELLRPLLNALALPPIPYLHSALTSLGDVLVVIAVAAVLAWRSPLAIVGLSGLAAPILRPVLWALLWFVPAALICILFAKPAPDVGGADVAWLGFGGPITEELVYRGLAIGVLVRLCGWHWLPACLLPALCFGLSHWGQGDDPGSIAGIVVLTGVLGLLLGWLFVRWRFNLWPALFVHIGVNVLWTVFDLGETALGGWFGNVMRLGVIVTAVGTTFWLAPAKATSPNS